MVKLLIFVLVIAIIAILFSKLVRLAVGANKNKYPSGTQLDELSAKASKNYEEREAIKQEVDSTEQVLQDIKSKTS